MTTKTMTKYTAWTISSKEKKRSRSEKLNKSSRTRQVILLFVALGCSCATKCKICHYRGIKACLVQVDAG